MSQDRNVVENDSAPERRRGRPSAEATLLRRAHLLQVARQIFVRRGYRATTMDEVAAAAGATKRTIYAWHQDKEALFRACVEMGAERFPKLPGGQLDPEDVYPALVRYVTELYTELSAEDSIGMGGAFLRESAEFPELAKSVQQEYQHSLIAPLADFLQRHGLEQPGRDERTHLFVAMALYPVHASLLVGLPLPDPASTSAHAHRCVDIFLGRGPVPG